MKMKKLLRKDFPVMPSSTSNGRNESGKIVINSAYLKHFIGTRVKVIIYGEQDGYNKGRYIV